MHSWTFCFAVQCFCKQLLATVGCLCLSASQHLHFLQMIALILRKIPPVPGPFFFFVSFFVSSVRGSPVGFLWFFSGLRFELELPTYLSQAGASEGWATDILTREKVNVMESSVPLLG